ncbi:TPA: hypothetical protein VAM27_003013 [Acinetobacter baumannii]|uniref:hypothetical protein n=1 Tax=Acinetobacter baumannii TaxID=470 RepID=UPI00112C7319|nr:hypothetical protein [Acinetobacter baumannii]TPT82698.1 hypothetical protein FJU52_14180 [Acinetobacter baumannii]HEO1794078.1 hypothetical protein [Acinetobacter baumannii]
MCFEVYSQTGNLSGVLLSRHGNNLLYSNTHITNEDTHKIVKIESGQSYELVNHDGDLVTINFESALGVGDGFSDELILAMMIHRTQAKLELNQNEQDSLALKSLKMAFDCIVGGVSYASAEG